MIEQRLTKIEQGKAGVNNQPPVLKFLHQDRSIK
jgi:hypothetical protein